MPRTAVFVSYVDTFVGARLLQQFQQYPTHYRVYGCTWDAAAADELNAAAAAAAVAAAHQQQLLANKAEKAAAADDGAGHGDAAVASALLLHDDEEADASVLEGSGHTMTPGDSVHEDPLASQADESALLGPGADSRTTASLAATHPGLLSGTLSTAAATAGNPLAGTSKPLRSSSACTFFSRHDTAAVRAALLSCDWIVLELREAQTVLEVVQFLQRQPSFARPKRLVLLSSLMTWYATPSLEEMDDEAAAGGEHDEGAEDDHGEGDEDELEEIDAPYPPTPPHFLENIVAAVQDHARYAVIDAMRADKTSGGGGSGGGGEGGRGAGDNAAAADGDGDDADGEDGEEGEARPGTDGAPELLTEDQFNRRVPHLQYLHWRDAEKAVAAAHHAQGLPLDTFVVCGGLPYGGEEDLLEPLFRLAWSAEAEARQDGDNAVAVGGTTARLPIFGTGAQRVPLVHAQDLACFVRKLLRCPADALPFPERRYLFATDGNNRNTWHAIVSGVNRMFGERCALQPIAPAAYPLYRDVERFTMDLCVEPETMRTIMLRTEDAEDGGAGAAAADAGAGGAMAPAPLLPNSWVAEGGLRRHLRGVADEFTTARHVDPLRIALVGPPLVGKTYLATRIARYYRLPCVSLDSVVADYTAALQELRSRVDSTTSAVREAERARRLAVKRRRLLARQQRQWDVEASRGGVAAVPGAGDSGGGTAAAAGGGGAGRGSGHSNGGDGADSSDPASRGSYRASSTHPKGGGHGGPGEAAAAAAAGGGGRDDDEVPPTTLALTAAEEEELDAFVAEWWAEQPQSGAWAGKIAEMERVLLLRLHPRPPTPEANPKKKAAAAGGAGAAAKKKGNKDAQKTREEEEELQQLKVALQHAPFQPRALALMLRWRLAQPDCRVQGFVLDGVPPTLEMARLVFGDGDDEQLQPPPTEEEALRPRYAMEGGAAAAAGGGAAGGAAGGDDGNGDADAGAAAAAPPKEVASDARLPNHVVVLQASDTYLLSRLKAMGAAAEEGAVTARGQADATRAVDVEAFHQAMQAYKREYVEMPYSVLSYWECAAAKTAAPLSTGGGGGGRAGAERRAEVHLVSIEGSEPLVPPVPPQSAHAAPMVSSTELLLEDVILGRPHNFGKSLEEVQREAVRQRCLEAEEQDALARRVAAQAAAESQECAQEAQARTAAEERLTALKQADVAELEARKLPMAGYLQERVLPLLHKGLLEVCATRPADPVDFLAEWLIHHNPHDDIFSDL